MTPTSFFPLVELHNKEYNGYVVAQDDDGYRKKLIVFTSTSKDKSLYEAEFFSECANKMVNSGSFSPAPITSELWEDCNPEPGSFAYLASMNMNRWLYG